MRFFKEKVKIDTYDFSDDKVDELRETINELREILMKAGFNSYIYSLIKVLSAAEQSDSHKYKSSVETNDLFGGAGALWEIYIPDKKLMKNYHNVFYNFILQLEKIGVKNKRIKQVLNGL